MRQLNLSSRQEVGRGGGDTRNLSVGGVQWNLNKMNLYTMKSLVYIVPNKFPHPTNCKICQKELWNNITLLYFASHLSIHYLEVPLYVFLWKAQILAILILKQLSFCRIWFHFWKKEAGRMLCLWIRKFFLWSCHRNNYIFFLPPCFMMPKRSFFYKTLWPALLKSFTNVKQYFSTDYLFHFVLLFLKKKWGNYMHSVYLRESPRVALIFAI